MSIEMDQVENKGEEREQYKHVLFSRKLLQSYVPQNPRPFKLSAEDGQKLKRSD
jgi:hypothetical protein